MTRTRPPRRRVIGAVLLALVMLVPAVAVTAGAPPPRSVCEPCHEDLERGAERHGIGIDVTGSTATMRVHGNGSATWTVTSRYAPGAYEGDPDVERRNASALATDADLRRDVALRAIGEHYGPDPDADRLRSVRANESAISFTFRERDVARETPGGVVLVDSFHTAGTGTGWYVDVTRLRIVGPDGTVIANDAASTIGDDVATAENRTLTLVGDVEDPPAFDRAEVYVAFARPGPAADLLAVVGIVLATLPIAINAFTLIHLPGFVVLVAVLALVRWRRGRGEGAPDRRTARRWAAGSVAVYLAVTLLVVPPIATPGMFFFVFTLAFALFGLAIGIANWIAHWRVGAAPS